MLDQKRLHDLLVYDKESGHFRWRVNRSNVLEDDIAGSNGNHGYREIRVDGKLYLAHRLAWLYVTGSWPKQTIDHENQNRLDNRWFNLREATHAQNNCNRGARSDNKSGVKGIYWHKKNKKWCATIRADGANKYLGSFDTKEDAHRAYCEAGQRAFGAYFNAGAIAA